MSVERSISILLLGGDPAWQATLQGWLEERHYRVCPVGSQSDPNLLRQGADLILLSIDAPTLPGNSFLHQIKADPTLDHIPVLILATADQLEQIPAYLELGAADWLAAPYTADLLHARLQTLVSLSTLQQRVNSLLNVVIPIGVQLLAEQDLNRMLELILLEAKALCHADAGTLYLYTDQHELQFMIVRNDSLGLMMGGTSGFPITLPNIPLIDATTGEKNHHNVASYAALTGEMICINDAYQTEDFDFSGTREFDRRTGYRSTSFLTVPLKDGNDLIGVLQLINAQDPARGKVICFDTSLHTIINSLATLATVALKAYMREETLRLQILELCRIDAASRDREVEQITQSDYFQTLQQRSRLLRSTLPPESRGYLQKKP